MCLLDARINIDALIRQHNFNSLSEDKQNRAFAQLNTNHDSTGIIIIPKVPVAKQTFLAEDDSGAEDKEFKNAHYWYDNLNEHFRNVIYWWSKKKMVYLYYLFSNNFFIFNFSVNSSLKPKSVIKS